MSHPWPDFVHLLFFGVQLVAAYYEKSWHLSLSTGSLSLVGIKISALELPPARVLIPILLGQVEDLRPV